VAGQCLGTTAVEGQEAVDILKQIGVDFIKVKSFVPREAYFAIAEEARRQQMALAGHVPDSVPVAEASHAGQKKH
jgi:hypothetical protein